MTALTNPTFAPPAADDTEHPWWMSAVVYQIYPRSFADADGDGLGDLRGIISRLDHLQELGVDVLWLSPIYASPQDDNGYDISDYQAIDPVFGTMADFQELVRQTHLRGMKLIMDLVVNHTSDEHEWFRRSRESRDSAVNPYRDWYWWRPARPGTTAGTPGAEPTNWESFFSGPTWTLDAATGEYYLHLFSPRQPDLNWENPAVRAAVQAMMRWWLDRGIDGFRMDVINLISKHTDLPDGVVVPGHRFADGFPFYGNGPRVHEFLQEMRTAVFDGRPGTFLCVGETPGVTTEEARMFTDRNRRELEMIFQFEHMGLDHGPQGKWDPIPLDVLSLKRTMIGWQHALSDIGWNSLYWNNHDQPRVVSRFGDDGAHWRASATALATALHLQRGTPFVYQGEELGMTNVPFAQVGDFRDIESIRYYQEAVGEGDRMAPNILAAMGLISRDNARTPVQWDGSPHAGFTSGTPWIPVNPNYRDINIAAQTGVTGSVLEHYRALIALRHREPAVAHGDFEALLPDHPTIFAFQRRYRGTELLVLVNLCGDRAHAFLDEDEGWRRAEIVSSNEPDQAHPIRPDGIRLRPWEAVVLRRRLDG